VALATESMVGVAVLLTREGSSEGGGRMLRV
jgi:hypothetical protein